MDTVRITDLDDVPHSPAAVKRDLTEALGTTDVAINYFELDPGDSFAYAYHAQEHQEEVFYIQSGIATFETADGPVRVGAGEVVRFPSGSFHRGRNDGDDRVVALAIGAPLADGEVEKRRHCDDCGEYTSQTIEVTGTDLVARCDSCGMETGRW